MIRVDEMESTERLAEMKRHYVEQATAPLDGMWLCGFVPAARHFGLFEDDDLIGFFCLNDDGFLLQFFVMPLAWRRASALFALVTDNEDQPCGTIAGAFVSTAEPHYFSLCLDRFSKFQVNALMYQHDSRFRGNSPDRSSTLRAIDRSQLPLAIDFAVASIGAPAQWLDGYYGNLIDRQELFGVWQGGELIATGERRRFDEHQTEYADLGVIVSKPMRSRGMATQVLSRLVTMSEAEGLKPICSTEKTNIGAQKAISRAGFVAHNRIVQFRA